VGFKGLIDPNEPLVLALVESLAG